MPDLLERLSSALGDRYAIEREVGRGGMAVVFLAEDLKHHRQVALKVLHPELTATLGAERFLQEIEIVAGLQHPHILPLYDSGEADGLLYYVMPYAEGESLRQRLDREKQLAVDESVRITVEVADGLDYAHRKGVVHRDIKPGNILLAEGHATIADFGIARAIEAARAERVTSTGLGVGTPLYASPEQATAQETLDGRTDIYSLGCVLYEMLAGQPPLAGATPQIIQARRVAETPSPLHALRDTVPPALDQVIARSLARIPADRYATASQFGQALQAAIFATTPAARVDVTPAGERPPPSRPGSRRLWRIGVPAVLGTAVVIAGAVLMLSTGWLPRQPLQITTSNLIQVTNEPGLEFQPVISPDGSEVAYVKGPIGSPRIVVRSALEVGTGESRPGEELAGKHWYPKWTPDGASLRFWDCRNRWYVEPGCEWKKVGSRGGAVQTVSVPRLSNRYAWSRDGSRVAFAWRDSIFAYSAEGGDPELLGVHTVETWIPHSLVWSPDGQLVAYVNSNPHWRTSANVAPASIWVLDANGGQPVPVTDEHYLNVSPQWLPDSRHLLFVSDRDGARGVYVVEVGPEGPSGLPRSVPGVSDPHSISISADGKKLSYAKFLVRQNIWSIPIPRSGSISLRDDLGDAVPVTTGNQVIEGFSMSPDGEWIAFDSDVRGQFDIYKQRLAGGDPQLVVSIPGTVFEPKWSPDGTELAFHSAHSPGTGGGGEVFVVSANGGTPTQLTDSPGMDARPIWSPDGLAIAFDSAEGVRGSLWMVSRDSVGGPWSEPVQLTEFSCAYHDWVPDGSGVICLMLGESILVSPQGETLASIPMPDGLASGYWPKFSPDGSRIYFHGTHEDGTEGIWWMPADGGSATRVVTFDDPSLTLFGFRVSSGNFYFVFAEYESDIWVMDLNW